MDLLSFILGRKTAGSGGGGGGSEAVLIDKNISANGTYNASSDNADGFKKVVVDVPNSYSAADEGKVVSNGALVSQTAHADVTPTTSDQTIDTTTNNSIKVKGDADLVAANIKKDVEIFGVTGSYEGSGGGGYTLKQLIEGTAPTGEITYKVAQALRPYAIVGYPSITKLTLDCTDGYTLVRPTVERCNGLLTVTVLYDSTQRDSGEYVIANNAELKTIVWRGFVYLQQNCFRPGPKVEVCDLEKAHTIQSNVFYGCPLKTLILRRTDAITILANTNAFSNTTEFRSGGTGGTLYVPNDLISSYQSASNWSTILGYANNQIKSIESTHTDPTAPFDMTLYYADGTPISA